MKGDWLDQARRFEDVDKAAYKLAMQVMGMDDNIRYDAMMDEIHSAANQLALQGRHGRDGEPLPHAMGKDAVDWINANRDDFRRFVKVARRIHVGRESK